MGKTLKFITTEREHLFQISQILAEGLPETFLRNAQNPVIVSVRGSYASGKKIFADAVRDTLLPDKNARSLKGNKEYDEIWTGHSPRLGNTDNIIEVDFLNSAPVNVFSEECMSYMKCDRLIRYFLQKRKHGGVSFIHNDDKFDKDSATINLWTESKASHIVGSYDRKKRIKTAGSEARAIFNHLSKTKDWVRYVELKISDQALFQSPEMKSAIEKLTHSAKDVHEICEKKARVFVYSEENPRMNHIHRIKSKLGFR